VRRTGDGRAKDTETVQLDPAMRLAQVVVSINPPVGAISEKASGLPPKLVMLTGWDALDVFLF